jgi:energy-coupling factor transport system ATP-binding protein
MIAVHDLHCRILAIDELDLSPGITSVIGPNGSGKSTFLKVCSGILEPESGRVLIDGRPPRKTGIGYIGEFPDRNIVFSTVRDELASTLRFSHTPCKETARAVSECAETMAIAHLLDRKLQELSGGEKILVAFAAACISRPKVLILDECDSHLDADRMRWLENRVRASGAAYIIRCTQQMETAATGDRLIFIRNGKVVHEGTPATVFAALSGTSFYPLTWRCRI